MCIRDSALVGGRVQRRFAMWFCAANWRQSFFRFLHKGGSATDPNKWRAIAVLIASYKILVRALFNCIRGIPDSQQSEEHFGFQRDRSTADALIVAESLVSKCFEFNGDLWLISVDLRKTFDQIEQQALFRALRAHGLLSGCCQMLRTLYRSQTGVLGDDLGFPITRGVKQGDSHGLALYSDGSAERLSNIRFADDLLLFATSMEGAVDMLDMLAQTLRNFGL
eukprot:7185767-Pyramimonas_sp.AAC.1